MFQQISLWLMMGAGFATMMTGLLFLSSTLFFDIRWNWAIGTIGVECW